MTKTLDSNPAGIMSYICRILIIRTHNQAKMELSCANYEFISFINSFIFKISIFSKKLNERHGVGSWTFFCLVLGTPWVWETSGDSLTCATEMEGVGIVQCK